MAVSRISTNRMACRARRDRGSYFADTDASIWLLPGLIPAQADFTVFRAAFFCRRGNRALFFFASFGTFGFAGAVTPTAAAIFPAVSPMVLAAATRALSGNVSFTEAPSGDPSLDSFFFAMVFFEFFRA